MVLCRTQPRSLPPRSLQLLTDTLVSALVVTGTALVPLAVVGLDRLPVGRLVGDPAVGAQNTVRQEALTQHPPTRAGRGSGPKQDVTCGADICRRSAGRRRAPPSPGRTDVSRTPSPRW